MSTSSICHKRVLLIVLTLLLQRRILAGLKAGAVKGLTEARVCGSKK